jgi:hypothetical protein
MIFWICGINLDRMNENKKDKPHSFPDSFLLIIGDMRVYFHLPYRQTVGIIKTPGKNRPVHPIKLLTDLQNKNKQIGYSKQEVR